MPASHDHKHTAIAVITIASPPAASARDCYRFCLSNPLVDVVITGPRDAIELRENLAVAEKGPLTPAENGVHACLRPGCPRLTDMSRSGFVASDEGGDRCAACERQLLDREPV